MLCVSLLCFDDVLCCDVVIVFCVVVVVCLYLCFGLCVRSSRCVCGMSMYLLCLGVVPCCLYIVL